MTPVSTSARLAAVTLTQRIIWSAMTLSQILLGVPLFVVSRAPNAPPAMMDSHWLDLPLAGVAGAFLLAASAWWRHTRADAYVTRLGENVRASAPEQRVAAFASASNTPLIVSLALSQGVTLCGFVLAFLHTDPMRFAPFLALGVFLNALAFPRPERLLERMRELVPQLGALGLLLAVCSACSFVGGDYTPMKKDPETPCSKEAEGICKEKLGSADFGTCVAREKYRCEVVEEEQQKEKPGDTPSP